jgi:hypothetical protein
VSKISNNHKFFSLGLSGCAMRKAFAFALFIGKESGSCEAPAFSFIEQYSTD